MIRALNKMHLVIIYKNNSSRILRPITFISFLRLMSLSPGPTLIKLIECGNSEVTPESECDNAD